MADMASASLLGRRMSSIRTPGHYTLINPKVAVAAIRLTHGGRNGWSPKPIFTDAPAWFPVGCEGKRYFTSTVAWTPKTSPFEKIAGTDDDQVVGHDFFYGRMVI